MLKFQPGATYKTSHGDRYPMVYVSSASKATMGGAPDVHFFVSMRCKTITVLRDDPYTTSKYRLSTNALVTDDPILSQEQLRDLVYTALPAAMGVSYVYGNVVPKLGTDPEVFAVTGKKKALVPAWKFLAPDTGETLQPYPDGPQAEFTVPTHTCLAYLTDEVQKGLAATYKLLCKYNPTATLSWRNTVNLSNTTLKNAPRKWLRFGCKPSLNVYGMQGCLDDPMHTNLRSAGYHMHMELTPYRNDISDIPRIIKFLDRTVGLFVTAIGRGLEDPSRRSLYGLPGEYRIPSENRIEYRVLGPLPLIAPWIHHLVWEVARIGVRIATSPFGLYRYWEGNDEEVVSAIMNTDSDAAAEILLRPFNQRLVFGKLASLLGNHAAEKAQLMVRHGLAATYPSTVKDGMVQNWKLATPDSWQKHTDNNSRVWVARSRYVTAP